MDNVFLICKKVKCNIVRMTRSLSVALNNTDIEFGPNDDSMLMSSSGYIAAAVTLFFIGFFGFFLNLCVIVLMMKDSQLWTPLNIILFNMICSDFSVSILGNPWTLLSAISYRWIFGRTMCIVYGFFMSLLGISSITSLAVLAFERYIIVSQPFRNSNLSKCGAFYLVICIWLYSLALTTPPLFGWGKYDNEAANISCSINWEEKTMNAMTYILYLFCFGLIVPLIVITFSYVHIINTMKKSKMRVGGVSKAEGRVAYMVLVMIIAFLIAWSPYAVLALLIQFGDNSLVTPATGVLPALLAKSSICYNPIIYVGLNTQFRQSLMQLIGKRHDKFTSGCETYAVGISKFISTQDNEERIKFNASNKTEFIQLKAINARKDSGNSGTEDFVMVVENKENKI